MREFEFDKIVLAIALAVFCVMISNVIGNTLYTPVFFPAKRGYQVEVSTIGAGEESQPAAQELPEKIDIQAIMAHADAKAGEEVFKKCAVCHNADKDGPNKVGPNLWGIVGAHIARREEYVYSAAMKEHGAGGAVWSEEELYRYLYSPKKRVPGTKMAFAGLKKDADRANVIAYLLTRSDPQPH